MRQVSQTSSTHSSHVQFLLDFGFELLAEWRVENPQRITYTLARRTPARGALYAFVSEDVVLYVGRCSGSIGSRLGGYKQPPASQRTNVTLHARIRELLAQGRPVQILGFAPPERLEYRGITLNLAAALEQPLIARTSPSWNQTRTG